MAVSTLIQICPILGTLHISPLSVPPCPSSLVGFARSAPNPSHISKLTLNASNRGNLKIMKQSFLDSQQTCRSVRRVSPRSACANDAQRCSSHLGRFSSGLPMSVYGIRGRCHRRGTTQTWGRQAWSLDLFCMWHSGHSSLGGKLIFQPRRILFARRMMQIWYSWKGNREGSSIMRSSSTRHSFLASREDAQGGTQEATRHGRRD